MIKYPTYQCGTNPGAPYLNQVVEEFNAEYEGVYRVEIEEMPSNQAYIDKIKILISAGQLPDVVQGSTGLRDLIIKDGYAVDMTDYLEADPEWKASIAQEAIDFNTIDGELVGVSDVIQVIGYFYNKTMFDEVGIKPAETWDEFMSNCEKLKAAGYTPIGLNTGENAWTTNLLLGSIVGTNGEAGNKFMNTMHPVTYEIPEFIDGLKMIQTLFQEYTTEDAVGAKYGNVINSFNQEQIAMIANGPWMIGDLLDETISVPGLFDRVGCAPYPGSGIFSSPGEGYVVTAKDKEHQDGAALFVKALTGDSGQEKMLEILKFIPMSPTVEISDEFKADNRLFFELIEARRAAENSYLMFDLINHANVTDAFSTLYPELIFDKITAEEMAAELTKIEEKNQ